MSYLLAALSIIVPFLYLLRSSDWAKADIYERLVMMSLASWVVASFFSIHMGIQFFCGVGVMAVTYAIKKRHYHLNKTLTALFILYFLWNAISLIWAPDIAKGLSRLRIYFLFVVIPLIFGCVKIDEHTKGTVFTAAIRTMGYSLAATFVTWLITCYNNNINPAEWLRVTKSIFVGSQAYNILLSWSNYRHPTYTSTGLMVLTLIGILTSQKRISADRLSYVEAALFTLATLLFILLIQSRIALLMWIILVPISIIYRIIAHKKTAITTSVALIAAAMAFCVSEQDKIERFFDDDIRIQNFKTAHYCIKKHPLLGSGIEGIRFEMDSDEIAKEIGFEAANKDLGNPHNQFVGDLMMTGVVGLTLCVAIYLYIIFLGIRERNFPLLMFMATFLMLSNIEMPFYLHKGVIIFLMFTLILLSGGDTEQITPEDSSHT